MFVKVKKLISFCCVGKEHFKWRRRSAKMSFSALWQNLLKYPLTPGLYKRVLILLPEKVIPHLDKPLLLTDFLINSYEIGK